MLALIARPDRIDSVMNKAGVTSINITNKYKCASQGAPYLGSHTD